MTKKERHRLGIRMDVKTYVELKKIAREQDRSVNSFVLQAVKTIINKTKDSKCKK